MRALPLLLVLGCHAERFPLDEVPILGASPAQERIIREELLQFDMWTEGQVQLKKVKVQGLGGAAGTYRDDVVRLADFLPDHDLPRVTRHELCHALDDALGWPSDDDPHAQQAFDVMIAHGVPSADRSDVHDRREGFAMVCERGPTGVAVLGACPGRFTVLADMGETVAHIAWPSHAVEPDRRREVLWSVDARGATEISVATIGTALSVSGIYANDQVSLTYEPTTGNSWVDARHGTPERVSSVYRTFPFFPSPPPDLYYVFAGEGDATLGVAWHRDELEAESLITVVDGQWSPTVDACPRNGEVLFAFETGIGTAWLEDDRAVVAELVPR